MEGGDARMDEEGDVCTRVGREEGGKGGGMNGWWER